MVEESANELLAFLRPDETAASLLSRAYVERRLTNIPFIDNHVGLKAGRPLEIAGPSGSGKTELLVQLSVNCILPKTYLDVMYGGLEGVAVFIDLDGRFQPRRLKRVLDAHILAAAETQTGSRSIPGGLSQLCLQRFHLIQCHSSFEFLAVLRLLGQILGQLQVGSYCPLSLSLFRQYAAIPEMTFPLFIEFLHNPLQQAFGTPKLLVIDNISAFYLMDRANHTVSRTPSASGAVIPMSLQRVQKAVGQELSVAGRRFHLAVVVSVSASVVVQRGEAGDLEEGGNNQALSWEKKEILIPALSRIFSQQLLLVPKTKLPDFVEVSRHDEEIVAYWKVPAAPQIFTFQVTEGIPRYGVLE